MVIHYTVKCKFRTIFPEAGISLFLDPIHVPSNPRPRPRAGACHSLLCEGVHSSLLRCNHYVVTRLNYNFPQLCIPILVSAATALHCVNSWKNWHHSIMSLEFDGSAL